MSNRVKYTDNAKKSARKRERERERERNKERKEECKLRFKTEQICTEDIENIF
jgi:hypothetical protein